MSTEEEEGKAGKAEGMGRAERHANPAWMLAAEQAVLEAARELSTITADDVMRRIPPDVDTHEKRALGPVMMKAAKAGIIEKAIALPRNSTRPNQHSAPITVWKSNVYKPPHEGDPVPVPIVPPQSGSQGNLFA